MSTISIKLGKKIQEFRIEKTICGIVLTNPETSGIVLSMYSSKYGWTTEYRVREIDFFEDELKEIAIKFVKKHKL